MANNVTARRLTDLERRQAVQDAKFEMFMKSMDDFKVELRDRDNQRAAEISALRTEMIERDKQRAAEIAALRQETNAKFSQIDEKINAKFSQIEEKISKLDAKMDANNKYAHNMFLAAAIGIGAMILTVVFPLILSQLREDKAPEPKPTSAIHEQVERPSDESTEGADEDNIRVKERS